MSEIEIVIVLSIFNLMLTATFYSIVLMLMLFERRKNNKKTAEDITSTDSKQICKYWEELECILDNAALRLSFRS